MTFRNQASKVRRCDDRLFKLKEDAMGAIPPDELLRLWTAEALPTERAIGQVVQHLSILQAALDRQSLALAELRAELGRLQGAANGTQAAALARRKSR